MGTSFSSFSFISHIRDLHQFIHAKGQNDHTLSSSIAYFPTTLPYPTTLLYKIYMYCMYPCSHAALSFDLFA